MTSSYISEFIEANDIKSGDLIQVANLGLEMKDKSVVFLGRDSYASPLFAICTKLGCRFLHSWEIPVFLRDMRPIKIMRFQGTKEERKEVVRIVRRDLNEDSFNLALNWCEPGRPTLQRSDKNSGLGAVGGIALGGLALLLLIALISKDE